jgi:hypothetical protein
MSDNFRQRGEGVNKYGIFCIAIDKDIYASESMIRALTPAEKGEQG